MLRSRGSNSGDSSSSRLRLFICYSRVDLAAADRLVELLEDRGLEVSIDRRDLPYGEAWQAELATFIRNADTVLWLVSPSSIASKWVNWELGEVSRLNKRLVPVVTSSVDPNELPEALGRLHLFPAEGIFDSDGHLSELITVLHTDFAWLKEHTRLSDRAWQWTSKGRTEDLLLRGGNLRDAEAWRDRQPAASPPPSENTLELILASRRAHGRRQTLTVVVSITLSFVGIVLAVIAWTQRDHALRQEQIAVASAERAREQETLATSERDRAEAASQEATLSAALAAENEQKARAQLYRSQINESAALTEQSLRALAEAEHVESMRLALEALPENLDAPERPYYMQAELALAKAYLANRLLSTIQPTDDWVNATSYSPDGKLIAAGTRDGVLALIDTANLSNVRTYDEARGAIFGIAFSNDGTLVATSHVEPSSVVVREVKSGLRKFIFPVNNVYPPERMAFTANDKALIFVADSGNAQPQIWSVENGRQIGTFGVDENESTTGNGSFDISPDGTLIALTSSTMISGRGFYAWDIATRNRVLGTRAKSSTDNQTFLDLSEHWAEGETEIRASTFVPTTGAAVLVGTKTVFVLDPRSREIQSQWRLNGEYSILAGVFRVTPDGDKLIVSAKENELSIFGVPGGEPDGTLTTGASTIADVSISPDSRFVAASTSDLSIHVWDLTSTKEVKVLRGHSERPPKLRFSPDGTKLLSNGDPVLRLWDLRSDADRLQAKLPDFHWQTETVSGSGDRAVIAVPNDGEHPFPTVKKIGLWDYTSSKLLRTIDVSSKLVIDPRKVGFAGDDAAIALLRQYMKYGATTDAERHEVDRLVHEAHVDGVPAGPGDVAFLEVLRSDSGATESTVIAAPTDDVTVTLSDDGSLGSINACRHGGESESDCNIALWNLQDRRPLLKFKQRGRDAEVRVSQDNVWLVVTTTLRLGDDYGKQRTSIWRIADAFRVAEFDGAVLGTDQDFRSLAARDRIISGGEGSPPQLMKLSTGEVVGKTAGQPFLIDKAIISGDRRWLLLEHKNAPWELWDLDKHVFQSYLPAKDAHIVRPTFSGDSRRIVTRRWNVQALADVSVFDTASQRRLKSVAADPSSTDEYIGELGTYLAFQPTPQTIQIVDTEAAGEPRHLTLGSALHRWRFTAEDERLVTADREGKVRIFASSDGRIVAEFDDADRTTPFGDYRKATSKIPILFRDGSASLVDSTSGMVLWNAPASAVVAAMLLCANDNTLIYAGAAGVTITDVSAGKVLAFHPLGGQPTGLHCTEASDRIVVHVAGGESVLISLPEGEVIGRFSGADQVLMPESGRDSMALIRQKAVAIIDLNTGAHRRSVSLSGNVLSRDISRSGDTVAIGTDDSKLLLIDTGGISDDALTLTAPATWVRFPIRPGELLVEEKGRGLSLRNARDGSTITSFWGEWQPTTTGPDWVFGLSESGARSAVLTPDGYASIAGTADGIVISGLSWLDKSVAGFAFLPDDKTLLAVTEDGWATAWNFVSNSEVKTIKLDGSFSRFQDAPVRLTSSRNYVLAVDQAGGVHIISLVDWSARVLSTGVPEQNVVADLSPDDTKMATLSGGGTLRLWDVAAAETVVEVSPDWSAESLYDPHIRFSNEGRRLIAEFSLTRPYVISLPPSGAELQRLALAIVGSPNPQPENTANKGRLGVQMADLTPDQTKQLPDDVLGGVRISGVIGGGAAMQGGIKRGDVIIAFNGKGVTTSTGLEGAVEAAAAERPITVTLVREDKRRELVVVLPP